MKRQKSCGPCLGKLVHQLPGVITIAHDLRLGCTIAHWKDLSEDYNSRAKITIGATDVILWKIHTQKNIV
jgi:hypothetical protein